MFGERDDASTALLTLLGGGGEGDIKIIDSDAVEASFAAERCERIRVSVRV